MTAAALPETLPATFFVPDGTGFRSTVATRGPWSRAHQHGGPSAALLARALELDAATAPSPMQPTRLTVLFHRPVPIERFDIAIEPVRIGKKVRIVRAHLTDAQGRAVVSAEGLFMRYLPDSSPSTEHVASPPLPEGGTPWNFFFAEPSIVGYHQAMEMRHRSGAHHTGEQGIWMRMAIALVPGETPSALQRVAIAADSGNGISSALDFEKFTFLNPDLTIYLTRQPRGEWIGVDAETRIGPDGVGLASSVLLDESGVVGRAAQGLVVEAR